MKIVTVFVRANASNPKGLKKGVFPEFCEGMAQREEENIRNLQKCSWEMVEIPDIFSLRLLLFLLKIPEGHTVYTIYGSLTV